MSSIITPDNATAQQPPAIIAAPAPSDPEIVIREVAEGLWTFSKPFARFGFLPFGGRSTAVRFANGDVWVLASTPLTPETKETIDKLGPVRYVMAGDILHYMYLHDFKKGYPTAKFIVPEGLVEKLTKDGLETHGAYGRDAPDTDYGFSDEIKACYFSGFANKDIAWLHIPSKTLIQADLLFNLPGKEQYSKSTKSAKIPLLGGVDPMSRLHKRLVWGQGTNKEAMKTDAATVASWDFDRIIPCHGDVIETGGNAAWKAAYSKYF